MLQKQRKPTFYCSLAGGNMNVRYFLVPPSVCASIQVAWLRSLRTNQVESLNQDPAMHVNSLLQANEAGCVGGRDEGQEREAPHREPQVE